MPRTSIPWLCCSIWRRTRSSKVLDNQQVLCEPVVRNGKKATVGYQPDVWKGWE